MRAQGADGAMTIATTAPDPYDIALAHSRYVARLASAGLTDRESFNALASAPFVRARMRSALPLPMRIWWWPLARG